MLATQFYVGFYVDIYFIYDNLEYSGTENKER
jgi:hypothetical protein